MRRSIFELRPAPQSKVDDLAALAAVFGHMTLDARVKRSPEQLNREIAQFIAVRTCLRLPLP